MAALARVHNLYVVGTALEANPNGRPYNTAALFDPAGDLVGAYRKVHLWAPMGEAEHMSAGGDLPVFDLPWGRTALAICYDLRFPELWRRYAEAGAHLVLVPAEWPARRVEHWRLLLRARAVENQYFVAGCNRAGGEPGAQPDATRFGGHSAVVDPWAQVLLEGDPEPGLFVTTLDLDEVVRARRLFPFLADRRPDVTG
jgi:predicted amidohydrolase